MNRQRRGGLNFVQVRPSLQLLLIETEKCDAVLGVRKANDSRRRSTRLQDQVVCGSLKDMGRRMSAVRVTVDGKSAQREQGTVLVRWVRRWGTDKRAVLTAIRDTVRITHRIGFLAAFGQEHGVFVIPFVACGPGRDDEVIMEHELAETDKVVTHPILYAGRELLDSYRVLCSTKGTILG